MFKRESSCLTHYIWYFILGTGYHSIMTFLPVWQRVLSIVGLSLNNKCNSTKNNYAIKYLPSIQHFCWLLRNRIGGICMFKKPNSLIAYISEMHL